MEDGEIIASAVEEYKSMCEAWILGADAKAGGYQIRFADEETDAAS